MLAQRETEAALSRHLQQEEQLARFRAATRERLEASCVKYDEVDLKQESLSRRQVNYHSQRYAHRYFHILLPKSHFPSFNDFIFPFARRRISHSSSLYFCRL